MKVNAMYFSATGTTRKITESIASALAQRLNESPAFRVIDFTLKENRNEAISFGKDDLVILGTPVYAGRVPNVLLPYLNTIQGNGATAVCVVLYGNRNYDDALIELRDIALADGFQVAAAGAFVGEHSFSTILAAGRPDDADMKIADDFGAMIADKLQTGAVQEILPVTGEEPYRKYYMPKDKEGNPVDIRKVTPLTKPECTDCKLCVKVCPMASIDYDDPSKLNGICIKCGACVKQCPVSAKYYDDPGFLRHQYELEEQFAARRAPELFV